MNKFDSISNICSFRVELFWNCNIFACVKLLLVKCNTQCLIFFNVTNTHGSMILRNIHVAKVC